MTGVSTPGRGVVRPKGKVDCQVTGRVAHVRVATAVWSGRVLALRWVASLRLASVSEVGASLLVRVHRPR